MSITTVVKVEIGDANGLNDLTSRCLGATAFTEAPIGVYGRGSASITLDNNDGALTPNGSGTYGSVDWFSQAVFISATVGTHTAQIFHGIVSEFELLDDGVNAYVQIVALDAMSTGGVGTLEWDIPTTTSATVAIFIDAAFDGGSGATGYALPLLGNPTSNCNVFEVGIDTNTSVSIGAYASGTDPYMFTGRAKDWVNAVVMPCGPTVAWPTTIDLQGGPSNNRTDYIALAMSAHLVRDSTTKQDFTFAEQAVSGELPFRNLVRQYTNDSMINNVTMTFLNSFTGINGVTITESNQASVNKYGTRSARFNEVVQSTFSTSTQLSAQSIAERWANTYADSSFVPSTFELSSKICNLIVGSSATSEQRWAELLDVSTGLCQIATIEYTPTGESTAVTEVVMINSRTIQMTPNDVRIELGVLPGDQTAAFVLDSDVLGVLDQNRLG